ncbi:MAG: tRNA pseudouridine(55) synthase TruB [Phycisphaerales bacterium]
MNDQPVTPGIIVMDKPEGPGSTGMVRLVKGRLRAGGAPKKVKVGHGGTLDPLASGVVVVLVGKATKLCDIVMAGEKRYLAGIDLSAVTPSLDRETERTEVPVDQPPTRAMVEAAAATFVGHIEQVPPAYSALWIDGKRAYNMVRAGEMPEMQSRAAHVLGVRVMSYAWPQVVLDIRCAKGVYIRSIARDLGALLGTGGMLSWLRRTQVGRWSIRDAVPPWRLPREIDPWDDSGQLVRDVSGLMPARPSDPTFH